MENKIDEIDRLYNFRKKFSISQEPIDDIFELMKKRDDILILKFPNGVGVSGMVLRKRDKDKEYKCIYVNTNEPIGRQRFTFAHELYHIYYEQAPRGICLSKNFKNDEVEKRAENFAGNLLIPKEYLLKELIKWNNKNSEMTLTQIFELQKIFKVSFQAILVAVDDLRKIDQIQQFKQYIPRIAENLYKYCNKTNWGKLEEKTLENDKNNRLNSPSAKFEFPLDFKENLITNYKNELISLEDVENIFDFFEEDNLINLIK